MSEADLIVAVRVPVLVKFRESRYIGAGDVPYSRWHWSASVDGHQVPEDFEQYQSKAAAKRAAGAHVRAWAGRLRDSAAAAAKILGTEVAR